MAKEGERIFFSRIYQKVFDTQFGIGGTSLVTAQRQLRVHTTPPSPFLPPFLSLMGGFLYQGVEWCVD